MIDNYDSFTFNVVRYFRELGEVVTVVLNDQVTLADLQSMRFERLVISPGPGTPNAAGISVAAIEKFAGQIPILGVCLGHQSIAQAFGGKIVPAKSIQHGKTSVIRHNGAGVFAGLPSEFVVARYHSLVVAADSLPSEFEVTARVAIESGPEEVMGIKHKFLPIEGVQFHPEAELTEYGHQLLRNFLRQ